MGGGAVPGKGREASAETGGFDPVCSVLLRLLASGQGKVVVVAFKGKPGFLQVCICLLLHQLAFRQHIQSQLRTRPTAFLGLWSEQQAPYCEN